MAGFILFSAIAANTLLLIRYFCSYQQLCNFTLHFAAFSDSEMIAPRCTALRVSFWATDFTGKKIKSLGIKKWHREVP